MNLDSGHTSLYLRQLGSFSSVSNVLFPEYRTDPSAAITTVGYGEITPRSFFGRLVTLPLLVFGLLLIALPTFVLGREFSLVWDMMSQHQVCSR